MFLPPRVLAPAVLQIVAVPYIYLAGCFPDEASRHTSRGRGLAEISGEVIYIRTEDCRKVLVAQRAAVKRDGVLLCLFFQRAGGEGRGVEGSGGEWRGGEGSILDREWSQDAWKERNEIQNSPQPSTTVRNIPKISLKSAEPHSIHSPCFGFIPAGMYLQVLRWVMASHSTAQMYQVR